MIRFNSRQSNHYDALSDDPEALARRVEDFRYTAGLPASLRELQVASDALPALAQEAARQWTAGFNPCVVRSTDFEMIYAMALE